jgi:RNA polymerase sigma factor (sigma-70 family)
MGSPVKTLLRDLLKMCETGDGEAVTELIRRFRPWALDFATAIIDDRDLAEDAVQEAFITAIQRLPDLREPNAFPGWLRQIIRTQAGRITRSRRELPEAWDDAVPASERTPQERLQDEELRGVVRQALSSLPCAGRDTAELFYLEEMSCAGISDLLGVPEGTVKRRLHDARARLRDMLLGYIRGEEPEVKEPKPTGLPL